MIKLLATIALLLAFSTPARALVTEDAIDDSQRLSAKESIGKVIKGNCITDAKGREKNIFICDQATIMGLDGGMKNLNFYFLDKDGDGIIYVTETEPIEGIYLVVGWGVVKDSKAKEISAPIGKASGCKIGGEGSKVFCMTKDEGVGFSSAVLR
jgi:hypothetical protein